MNKLTTLALLVFAFFGAKANDNTPRNMEASIHYIYTIDYTVFFDFYMEFLDDQREVIPSFDQDTLELHFIAWLADRVGPDVITRHGWKIDITRKLQL